MCGKMVHKTTLGQHRKKRVPKTKKKSSKHSSPTCIAKTNKEEEISVVFWHAES